MELSIVKSHIDKNKPTKIILYLESMSAVFYMNEDGPRQLLLKTQSAVEDFMQLMSTGGYHVESRKVDEKVLEYTFVWSDNGSVTPYERVLTKLHSFFVDTPVMEATLSSVFPSEADTDRGTYTIPISAEELQILWQGNSQATADSVTGSVKELALTVSGAEYIFSQYKVSEGIAIKVRRVFKNFKNLNMNLPTEFKSRLRSLESGMIISSFHRSLKMEHAIPALVNFDDRAIDFTCAVGDILVATELPQVQNLSQSLSFLKQSHYRYIILGRLTQKDEINKALELVYAGKTVIAGVDSNSLYGCLMAYLSIISDDGSGFELNRHLSSCVGFYHSKVSIHDGALSLEDSECVPLSDVLVREICDGRISTSIFRRHSEKAAKVFNLGPDNKIERTQKEEFDLMLVDAVKQGASDVHLAVGTTPKFTVDRKLVGIYSNIILTPEMMEQIVASLVEDEDNKAELQSSRRETFIPYSLKGIGRFRVQIVQQRGTYAIAIRYTPFDIPTAQQMRIPEIMVKTAVSNQQGLILITGPTGSGKSTTSNVIIDNLKRAEARVIVSLADPIEFMHGHGDGIVIQREIPTDTESFSAGLSSIFRLRPNIVEVGEMRELASIDTVLRLVLSGHLVITSWHAESILGAFQGIAGKYQDDEARRREVLDIIGGNLVLAVNQRIVPGTKKSVPIFEYLIPNSLVRTQIATNKVSELESFMKTQGQGNKEQASWSDYELIRAYLRKEISEQVMREYVRNKDDLAGAFQLIQSRGDFR